MLWWGVMKEKLMKLMFKEQVREYEEQIELLHQCMGDLLTREMELGKDLSEQIEFNHLYEEELIRVNRELNLMNMIVESMNLQGGKNE